MEFELTKEQKQIQKSVREFVKGEFKKELILELEEKHEYPKAIWKKAAELGFIGIHFPEKYSGQGLGVLKIRWSPKSFAEGIPQSGHV